MKVRALEVFVVLGRKLDEMYSSGQLVELSPEQLESDEDLQVLIPFALMIGTLVESLGFEPLSEESVTPEYTRRLEQTMSKYLSRQSDWGGTLPKSSK